MELRSQAQAATRQTAELTAELETARRAQASCERGLEIMEAEHRTLEQKAVEYVKRIEAIHEKLMQLGYRQDVSVYASRGGSALRMWVFSKKISPPRFC